MLYSCHGDNPKFLIDNFQNAKKSCKNGIRSFLNEDGLDFIESTPGIFQSWSWFFLHLFTLHHQFVTGESEPEAGKGQ